MITTASLSWHEANQRHLTAALAILRQVLQRHAARVEAQPGEPASAPHGAETISQTFHWEADELAPHAALEVVCRAFALSPFERDILLLCAGVELDASFTSLCAAVQGEPRRPYPTFSLALAALPEAHWSALTPVAPLRHWRLIEVGPGDTVTVSPLRIDERVLHYLTGVSYLDERLRPLLEPLHVADELPPSHHAIARRITDLWSWEESSGVWPAILLCGTEQAGKRTIAAAACAALGLQVHALHAADLPHTAAERQALAHLWEREALLGGSALLLDCDALDSPDSLRTATAFLESVRGMVFVTSREPFHTRPASLPASGRMQTEPCGAKSSVAERPRGTRGVTQRSGRSSRDAVQPGRAWHPGCQYAGPAPPVHRAGRREQSATLGRLSHPGPPAFGRSQPNVLSLLLYGTIWYCQKSSASFSVT